MIASEFHRFIHNILMYSSFCSFANKQMKKKTTSTVRMQEKSSKWMIVTACCYIDMHFFPFAKLFCVQLLMVLAIIVLHLLHSFSLSLPLVCSRSFSITFIRSSSLFFALFYSRPLSFTLTHPIRNVCILVSWAISFNFRMLSISIRDCYGICSNQNGDCMLLLHAEHFTLHNFQRQHSTWKIPESWFAFRFCLAFKLADVAFILPIYRYK